MPELPDVAGFKNYLDATSLHKTIVHTHIHDERILEGTTRRSLSRRLKGAEFQGSYRHGKYLFVDVGSRGNLVLHFGMTGDLCYYNKGDRPRFTKLLLDFENGCHLAYQSQRLLGEVGYTDDRDAFTEAHDLGPDALQDELDETRFVEALAGRRGGIKPALMNQAIVAGIGNVYSDEILFQAGLHPATTIDQLDRDQLGDIYRIMRRVLRTAARHGGDITELPGTYLIVNRQEMGPCPVCGGTLEKETVSGRTARYCPSCQKKPGSRR